MAFAVGDTVLYNGTGRQYLVGKSGEIKSMNANGTSALVKFEGVNTFMHEDTTVWVGVGALEEATVYGKIVSELTEKLERLRTDIASASREQVVRRNLAAEYKAAIDALKNIK